MSILLVTEDLFFSYLIKNASHVLLDSLSLAKTRVKFSSTTPTMQVNMRHIMHAARFLENSFVYLIYLCLNILLFLPIFRADTVETIAQ